MAKYRFRYAMSIEVDADSIEEAEEIFEDMDLDGSEFVELEDISEVYGEV